MKIKQLLFKILRKQNDVTDGRTHTRTDNVKTVYPPQTKFAGGIKISVFQVTLGRVGTHIFSNYFFLEKNIFLCILKGISPFKMYKIIYFFQKTIKSSRFHQ